MYTDLLGFFPLGGFTFAFRCDGSGLDGFDFTIE